MFNPPRQFQRPFNPLIAIGGGTGLFLTLILLSTSTAIFAHGGHGDEFQGGNTADDTPELVEKSEDSVEKN